jgi:hypothetical protein
MSENEYIQQEESSIDFGAIWSAVTKRKKLYYKVLPIAFVLACIYALGIPNYYNCTVMLAPELSGSSRSSSLSAIASQFGIGGLGSAANGADAVGPQLYPDLMNSVDFKASLFNIPVHKKDSTRIMSYYDYIAKEQKSPWWSAVISAPFKALGALLGSEKDTIDQHKVDPFMLTKEQAQIVQIIDKKVVCDVDKKTMVITIDVTDQDPLICAVMADSVQKRLQAFITDYRTKKARVDLEYTRKLYNEAKVRYTKARQLYASYSDANQDIILESVKSKLTDLENEMQLQFNTYSAISQQLQMAEAKVQQETPAFTTLQSATVPVKKAGPSRAKMVLIFLFLAFLGTTVYILHKENQLKPLLGLS